MRLRDIPYCQTHIQIANPNILILTGAKMTSNCIFCKIINRTEKADILYEDEELIIFKDIKPSAKTHVLVVPKVHLKDVKSLKPENKVLVEKLISSGKRLLEEQKLNLSDTLLGFHWPPFNSISHLHLHVINPASEMSFLSRVIFKPGTMWFVTADYALSYLSKKEQISHL